MSRAKIGLMRVSTHERILAEQIKADDAKVRDLIYQQALDMAAFTQEMANQSAFANDYLRQEVLALQTEIAALKGKLVHVMDAPEPAVVVDMLGR
jgi:hypothetical protein